MDDDRETRYTKPHVADDRETVITRPSVEDDRETRYQKPGDSKSPGQDDRETRYERQPQRPDAPDSTSGGGDGAGRKKEREKVSFEPGVLILNRKYELLERIRGGVQAYAFRARSVVDDRVVFVKIQENSTREKDVFAKQLALRDRLLSINHPNLLKCHEIGLHGEALCEVYEFVEGPTLEEWLEERREKGQPASAGQVKALVSQLAAGIDALHEHTKLMHRDIAPKNIMVFGSVAEPTFMIVDYGAVSRLDSSGVTEVAGTRRYSPPESYERYTENSNLSRSWDWWSLGRIVQEFVDGIHAQDRIAKEFSGQVTQIASELTRGDALRMAIQAVFDKIMSERDFSVYQMHAGMVELSARNPDSAPFIPLLRGLLTYSRRGRWGYEQVKRLLKGELPEDSYNARREVDLFELDGGFWTLSQLAVRLAADSAQDTDEAAARWERAKALAYRGDFALYIKNVLEDQDLRSRLNTAITRGEGSGPAEIGNIPRDRDIGTALALFTLADGLLEVPSVRGKVLDASYVVALAQRLFQRTNEAGQLQLRELLSGEFQTAVRSLCPPEQKRKVDGILKGIEQLRNDREELQRRLRSYNVEYARSAFEKYPEKVVLWLAATRESDIESIEREYRPKLYRTTNASLQGIYADPNLQNRDPIDVKALRVALLEFKDNGFETYELQAQVLKTEAEKLRSASAMRFAAFLLWRPRFLRFLCWVAPLVLLVILLNSGIGWTGIGSGALINSGSGGISSQLGRINWPLVLVVSAGIAVLLFGILKLLRVTVPRDLTSQGVELADKGNLTRQSLLKNSAYRAGQEKTPLVADYSRRLRGINAKIRALTGIDHEKYVVRHAKLPLSSFLSAVAGVVVLSLAFGGPLYRTYFRKDAAVLCVGHTSVICARNGLTPMEDWEVNFWSKIGSGDIPIRTTREYVINRGLENECVVPAHTTVYLKNMSAEVNPGGRWASKVVLPKSLCPNDVRMHLRVAFPQDALDPVVLGSAETKRKLEILAQRSDDYIEKNWPQFHTTGRKVEIPAPSRAANSTRCVDWSDEGQQLRFTGKVEREGSGRIVAHMLGTDPTRECWMTAGSAWSLVQDINRQIAHAKDANYRQQFEQTREEVNKAAVALNEFYKRHPVSVASRSPESGGERGTARSQNVDESPTPASASDKAGSGEQVPHPTPAALATEVSGTVSGFSPEGWPVINGQTLKLSGIGNLWPNDVQKYEAWIRDNGASLDCTLGADGGYTCITGNQSRVDIGLMLLMNGGAAASPTAPQPYRVAMVQAMQAKRGRWKPAQGGDAP